MSRSLVGVYGRTLSPRSLNPRNVQWEPTYFPQVRGSASYFRHCVWEHEGTNGRATLAKTVRGSIYAGQSRNTRRATPRTLNTGRGSKIRTALICRYLIPLFELFVRTGNRSYMQLILYSRNANYTNSGYASNELRSIIHHRLSCFMLPTIHWMARASTTTSPVDSLWRGSTQRRSARTRCRSQHGSRTTFGTLASFSDSFCAGSMAYLEAL